MRSGGSSSHILSLDLGTTNLKGSIVDRVGQQVRNAQREMRMVYPQPGWAEQDAQTYWETVVDLLREVAAGYPLDALALSSQRGGLIFVDRGGQAISRIITWLDRRSQGEAVRATEAVARLSDADQVLVRRGPSVLSKVMWFREHEPGIVSRAVRALISVKDYVLYQMVGRWVTDIPQASLSGLYDARSSSWHPELVTLAGLDVSQLPELKPPTALAGSLRGDIASAVGLPSGLPVIVGSGDAEAAHLGLGAFDYNTASMNLGTIGALRVTHGSLPAFGKDVLACVDVRPYGWIVGAMVRTAGAILRWLRDVWSDSKGGWEFLDEAAAIAPGAEGLLVLPHFSGSNHPDIPNARGVAFGLMLHHGRGHVVRASLEGIAFALADALAYLEKATRPCTRIRVSGGGTQSPVWLQIVADVCNRPLELPAAPDASLLGAAMMGMVGIGVYPDLHGAISGMVRIDRTIHPDAASTAVYRDLRVRAGRLLEHLQPYFDELMGSVIEGGR